MFIPVPRPTIPAELLTPNEIAMRPGPTATQRDAALVIADLLESIKACNADKEALSGLLSQQ